MASKKNTKPVLVKKKSQHETPQKGTLAPEHEEPSEEYQRFEGAMRTIFSVPKEKVVAAEKKAKTKRKRAKK